MEETLCILIVAGTLYGGSWLADRVRPEPYDWPAWVLRAAHRRSAQQQPVITYRAALGRMPGETDQDWGRRLREQIR
jgi:hypothetical protein